MLQAKRGTGDGVAKPLSHKVYDLVREADGKNKDTYMNAEVRG